MDEEGQAQERPAAPGSRHILVADDEDDVREVICDLVRLDGYRVTGVPGGEEALAEVQKGRAAEVVAIDDDRGTLRLIDTALSKRGLFVETFSDAAARLRPVEGTGARDITGHEATA